MKEQLEGVILSEAKNLKVNGLTTHSFPPTLRSEGNIFMAEPGLVEIKKPGKPQPQRAAENIKPTDIGKIWEERYFKGRDWYSLPFEERQAVAAAMKAGHVPRRHPVAVAGGQDEQPPETGAADVGQPSPPPEAPPAPPAGEREEGRRGEPRLPIGETGVSDLALSEIARSFNRRLARRRVQPETIEQAIRDIEQRMRDPALSEEDWIWADTTIEQLEQMMADIRAEIEPAREARYGFYGNRELTPEEKGWIRTGRKVVEEQEVSAEEDVERLFNRMFDRVDVKPKVQFGPAFGTAGSLEEDEFIRTLNEAAADPSLSDVQRRRAGDLVRRYADEKELREIAHNANYAVIANVDTKGLVNFVQQFDSSLADLAFSKRGVVEAFHFLEQALLKVRAENGGYIPPFAAIGDPGKGIRGRVEELARKYFNDALRMGLIKEPQIKDPQTGEAVTVERMDAWEIDRAISIARGMGIITGRTIEIATLSILPEKRGDPIGPRFGSQYAHNIIQNIAPFRHLIYKYNIGEDRNRVFAYLSDREEGKQWNKKELREFDWERRIDVINGLVEDNEERFLGSVNPFRLGGIFSRTAWRVGDDPVVGATGDFVGQDPANRERIGTGVIIEIERGFLRTEEALRSIKDPDERERQRLRSQEAEQRIRGALEKVAKSQPLKLYFNMPDIQDTVLRRLFRDEILAGVIRTDLLIDEETEEVKKIDESTIRRDLKQDQRYKDNAEFKAQVDQMEKELEDVVNSLVLLQDQAVSNKITDLTELNPTDPNLLTFIDTVRDRVLTENNGRLLNNFITNLRDKEWKLPYNLGTDDVPLNEYRFVNSGGNAISRRWNDIGAGALATQGTIELIKKLTTYRSQEPIVADLGKIFESIAQYDEPLARSVTMKLAEGVMKFYKKDWYARLPSGVGTFFNVTGRHSFAELAFGKGNMSWDEVDLNGFTRLLRDQGLITLDQQRELQGKAGGTRRETIQGYARLLIPIITLALAYYVFKEASEVATERR